MEQIELTELTAVPVIIALVELVKRLKFVPEQLYPVISLAFGFLIAFLLPQPWDLQGSIIKGLIFGLSASGLFSAQKAVRGL